MGVPSLLHVNWIGAAANAVDTEHFGVVVTPIMRVFLQGLSRSAAAKEPLALQRGVGSMAPLERRLDRPQVTLGRCYQPLRLAFEQTLRRVVELGSGQDENALGQDAARLQPTPQMRGGSGRSWKARGVEPTNNAAVVEVFSVGVRALQPAV